MVGKGSGIANKTALNCFFNIFFSFSVWGDVSMLFFIQGSRGGVNKTCKPVHWM